MIRYEKFLKDMPLHKIKHSFRVAQSVTSLHPENLEAVQIALFHDFLEQGGNESVLMTLKFNKNTIDGIIALTAHDSDPLSHIKETIPTLPDKVKNLVVIVKLCDRLDNLEQRYINNTLTETYLNKSEELTNWLFSQYNGEIEHLILIRKKMKVFGCKPKKKFIYNV